MKVDVGSLKKREKKKERERETRAERRPVIRAPTKAAAFDAIAVLLARVGGEGRWGRGRGRGFGSRAKLRARARSFYFIAGRGR